MPMVVPLCLAALTLGAPSWAVAVTPLFLLFGLCTALDHVFGRDHRNVSLEIVMGLEDDPYYRRLLFLVTGLFGLSLLLACWIVSSGVFGPLQSVLFGLGLGLIHAPLVLIGHELGHARSLRDRRMARVALGLIGYGHFSIEHNSGHHVHVATPRDPASARYGESLYRFAMREIPGVLMGALRAERARLARRGLVFWHLQNTILQSWLVTGLMALAILAAFGPAALAFYALICASVWFTISMANYTAHYGLARRMIDGRREPCRPEHSWNSSFFFSNLLFFNLQRHSDHHTNAQKPFQTLSDVDGAPELPSGYPGVFALMLVPPLWYAVIHPILMQAIDGDETRLNTGRQA
ncbi:alkane 1-monooxygenase [Pararhodobacter sp. CCB-MM2]|uniref:alkane 1-monooxygenase n=1 Tax=Pararhodobacter sp. CCB-MM2 TaxID=1786003 RepID=UPI0009F547FF|nr:alkane 1-monooxygenase [Pararhodobacter sp. CCB-MM2]